MATPKSASKIGTLFFKESGTRNTLFVGHVAGTLAVWQVVDGGKARRTSGRKLEQLIDELEEDTNEGFARWEGERNDAALDALLLAVRG